MLQVYSRVIHTHRNIWGFPGGQVVKNQPANAGHAGDVGSISGSGRSPGEGNGNLFQYSCMENPMDLGAWQVTVNEVTRVGHNLATKSAPHHT